jgi:serine/threonine-protein kinase
LRDVAGRHFTEQLIDGVCGRALHQFRVDLRANRAMESRVAAWAEVAKQTLGVMPYAEIDLVGAGDDGLDLTVDLPRAEFENLIAMTLVAVMEQARAVAGADRVDHLVTVGASSAIPAAAAALADTFPKVELWPVADPAELTVLGAAILAAAPPVRVFVAGEEPAAPAPPPPLPVSEPSFEPQPPPPAIISPPPAASPAALSWREVEVLERRRELTPRAWLAVETPLWHLAAAPETAAVTFWLPDPPPEALSLALQIEGRQALVQDLALPPAARPGQPLTIRLEVGPDGLPTAVLGDAEGGVVRGAAWAPPLPPAPPPAVERYGQRTPHEQGHGVTVWRAVDQVNGRAVLVKEFAAGEETARNLYHGALQAVGLDHPNLARVLDFGPCEAGWFVVCEYDDLPTLRAATAGGGPRPLHWALEVMAQVTAGVAALHERHVIHRNLKPSNILLDPALPLAKVADFEHAVSLRGRDHCNDLVGTLSYMAREVLERRSDQRADVYALGVMLFELLTGSLPFAAQGQKALMAQIRAGGAPLASGLNPELPPAVDTLLATVLAADAHHRPATAGALSEALAALRAAI